MQKISFFCGLLLANLAAHSQNTFPVNGNVGIGINIPSALLHVAGKSRLDGFIGGSYTQTITGSSLVADYRTVVYNVDPASTTGLFYRTGNGITWNNSTVGTTSTYFNFQDVTVNSSVAENLTSFGTSIRNNSSSSSSSMIYNGFSAAYSPNAGSGAVGSYRGFINGITSLSNGTLTNYYGFINQPITVTNSALTAYYGYWQGDVTGAAGNTYGYYSNVSSGTNKWAFYSNGTASSYFAGNIGIGTTSPAAKLDVNGPVYSKGLAVKENGDNVVYTTQSGKTYHLIGTYAGWDADAVYIAGYNQYNNSTASNVNKVFIGGGSGSKSFRFDLITGNCWINNPNALPNFADNYSLNVNGDIRANKLVVNTTGADFVFEPGYKLTPLNQLERYVTTNRHLPGIETANTMQKDGVDVGDNQTKLLQKIEELTLYIIEQNKTLCSQNEALLQQSEQLQQLRKEVDDLKAAKK